MFEKKNRYNPPDTPFVHADDCRIVKADPNVEILWSRLEYGQWRRECVCSYEGWQEPAPGRVRLDPHDPKTARHMGQCEFKDVTDPDVIKVLLRTTEKDGYWWVECAGCESGWQVPFYAPESAGAGH
jgi:hypothetical protein